MKRIVRPGLRTARRGFTLVEIMISLVISTLVVVMILSIFARLSFSLREQQQIVSVQQMLAAARTAFENDAKQAGLLIADGFTIAADGSGGTAVRRPPVMITNSATAPDSVTFFYADPSAQGLVLSGNRLAVVLDSIDNFVVGDLVVLSTATSIANPLNPTDAKIATFQACVLRIGNIAGTTVTFATGLPFGTGTNSHCAAPAAGATMLYRFAARAWRIDTTRPGLAPLQMNSTGNIFAGGTWQDMAYGFTDLQVSSYFYDGDATDTNDPDTDPLRDWESGPTQTTRTAAALVSAPAFMPMLMMTISLVNRTDATVEGVFTTSTPVLLDPLNINNNTTGDRPAVSLPSPTDPMLMGQRIYRYITFQVDLRNMGVGR